LSLCIRTCAFAKYKLTSLRNRGELAEGWYDPSTKTKATASFSAAPARLEVLRDSPEYTSKDESMLLSPRKVEEDSEDDDIGPPLPPGDNGAVDRRRGPVIPGFADLQDRREMEAQDRRAAKDDLRYDRKLDRKAQKERLDELVPRADAGTRERQLEKKKDVNEKMRAFREPSPGGEVPENELLGSEGGEGFKAIKKAQERKKNERELRKDEILRARAAEREEAMQMHRDKEDKTMTMLRALAKQNFGS
jgi:hypothetical protein